MESQVSTDEEDEMEDTISPLGGEMSLEEMVAKTRASPRLEHRPLQRSASASPTASASASAWPRQRKVFEPRDSRSDPRDPEIFLDGKDSPKQLMPVTNIIKYFHKVIDMFIKY